MASFGIIIIIVICVYKSLKISKKISTCNYLSFSSKIDLNIRTHDKLNSSQLIDQKQFGKNLAIMIEFTSTRFFRLTNGSYQNKLKAKKYHVTFVDFFAE